jgi:hypothetical protein
MGFLWLIRYFLVRIGLFVVPIVPVLIRFQITDQHGKAVQGITLRQPFTIRYHYNPAVVASLGLDPGSLDASWPDLLFDARTAHQPTAAYAIPLQNNPKTHTLTGESSVFSNGPFDVGSGTPANQSPPTPLVASVAGNSGQLSYSYPLTVAPGPPGTTPDLQLVYSSEATNERTNRASPASDFGEGWSLSLGAITADEYPSDSAGGQATWYSLSGVDGISDLLVPNPQDTSEFLTEHISYLRIRKITSSKTGQPCFQVWDTGGTRYDFGCTSDSLQYYTDGNGTRHNYRWDVDLIVPANEGPGTDGRFIQIYYLQDGVPQSDPTTIRDSAIKQIIYEGVK